MPAHRLRVVQPRAGTAKEQCGTLGVADLRRLFLAYDRMGSAHLRRDIDAVLHDGCDRALRAGNAQRFAVLVRCRPRVRRRDTDEA